MNATFPPLAAGGKVTFDVAAGFSLRQIDADIPPLTLRDVRLPQAPGWEAFVRRLMDTEKVEIFLSGSSAWLLSREVANSMRGRVMEVRLYPFSFREYLRHHGCEPQQLAARLPKAERSLLQNRLEAYLLEGGFPEAQRVHPVDRYQLLRGYVDVVLLRDVIDRYIPMLSPC